MFEIHLANGRPDLAMIIAALPAAFFADADMLMRAAWLVGRSRSLGIVPDLSEKTDDAGERE